MEEQLTDQLYEDVSALANFLYSTGPLPPSYVRITASAVLRKWLIDGWISKLSSYTHAKYTFKTHDTTHVVQAIENEATIRFFMTAGVNLNGVPMKGIYVSDAPAPTGGKPLIPIDNMPLALFKPSKLLRCKRIFFKINGWILNKSSASSPISMAGFILMLNESSTGTKSLKKLPNILSPETRMDLIKCKLSSLTLQKTRSFLFCLKKVLTSGIAWI